VMESNSVPMRNWRFKVRAGLIIGFWVGLLNCISGPIAGRSHLWSYVLTVAMCMCICVPVTLVVYTVVDRRRARRPRRVSL
jgi:hypothetical protein